MAQDIDIEEATTVNGSYNADQIHVLEGLEAVRKRPHDVYWQYLCPWSAPFGV